MSLSLSALPLHTMSPELVKQKRVLQIPFLNWICHNPRSMALTLCFTFHPCLDKGNFYKIEKALAAYDEDATVVIDHLMSRPDCTGKIGATGMCLGGHLAFRVCFFCSLRDYQFHLISVPFCLRY